MGYIEQDWSLKRLTCRPPAMLPRPVDYGGQRSGREGGQGSGAAFLDFPSEIRL